MSLSVALGASGQEPQAPLGWGVFGTVDGPLCSGGILPPHAGDPAAPSAPDRWPPSLALGGPSPWRLLPPVAAEAPPAEPLAASPEEAPSHSWIRVVVEDPEGRPLGGLAYLLRGPDGRRYRGRLDEFGALSLPRILEGLCDLQLSWPS